MSTADTPFDEYAHHYDAWFLENRNVLQSEVLLLKRFLLDPGRALSVGCGSGLFEHILRSEQGIDISDGVEPAEGMARIAAKRGLDVQSGTAEHLPFEDDEFDTVLLNGITGYLNDLGPAFGEAARVLRPGGRIVVADVPAESSYGLLYALVGHLGSWDAQPVANVAPAHPYPAEFVGSARWRTTGEKAEVLRSTGFVDLEFAQTLTRHPKYSNDSVEVPVDGFDRGDYVAIRGRKG